MCSARGGLRTFSLVYCGYVSIGLEPTATCWQGVQCYTTWLIGHHTSRLRCLACSRHHHGVLCHGVGPECCRYGEGGYNGWQAAVYCSVAGAARTSIWEGQKNGRGRQSSSCLSAVAGYRLLLRRPGCQGDDRGIRHTPLENGEGGWVCSCVCWPFCLRALGGLGFFPRYVKARQTHTCRGQSIA